MGSLVVSDVMWRVDPDGGFAFGVGGSARGVALRLCTGSPALRSHWFASDSSYGLSRIGFRRERGILRIVGSVGRRRKGENKEEKGENHRISAFKPFDDHACNLHHIPHKYQWPQEEVDMVAASK